MPTYIEFDKNSSLPTPDNQSKVIIAVNADGTLVSKNSSGSVTQIGAGSGYAIPQPIIGVNGASDDISYYFRDEGFDFTSGNPELFLFRWSNTHKKKNVLLDEYYKKHSGWVHPVTQDATTKWNGWKYFSGNQLCDTVSGSTIINRITEFTVPSNTVPYSGNTIHVNRYMFWTLYSDELGDTTKIKRIDENFFTSEFEYSFSPTNKVYTSDFTYSISLSGNHKLTRDNNRNIVKYCLALAIDNPIATKTNGLCPKIFGPMSEPFYSKIYKDKDLGYNDVEFVKENTYQHKNIIMHGLTTNKNNNNA
jgi:hypothetical protein